MEVNAASPTSASFVMVSIVQTISGCGDIQMIFTTWKKRLPVHLQPVASVVS
jgi:hypothetical protein